MSRISLPELEEVARCALGRAGANDAMAVSTARALVAADAQGLDRKSVV